MNELAVAIFTLVVLIVAALGTFYMLLMNRDPTWVDFTISASATVAVMLTIIHIIMIT